MAEDTYRTLTESVIGEPFKDRGSKFIAYAFHVQSQEQIDKSLAYVRKEHHKARHWCYAWSLGIGEEFIRFNDDGEPANSAGKPILGQIQAFELTQVLIVVVRYFGGTKLGVGGLIHAYREAAKLALQSASMEKRFVEGFLEIRFGYDQLNQVMRLIKQLQVRIVEQIQEQDCHFILATRKSKLPDLREAIQKMHKVKIKASDD